MRYAFEFLRDCELGYNLLTVPKPYFVQLVKVSEGLLYCLLGPYLGPKICITDNSIDVLQPSIWYSK